MIEVHSGYGVEQADVEAVNSPAKRVLYKARVPIYPKAVHGFFRRLKWVFMLVLLGIYYGVPWIRWDRGPYLPDQAVLIDLNSGRFYFFLIELWPQEVIFLTGLLVLAALGLFLVTALFGRVWCGYACPQTVWTDLFLAVERFVEGDRSASIRLAQSKWSASKVLKKGTKHIVWLLISVATGGAWIFYFHDAPSLAAGMFTGEAPASAYLFCGALTFTTYMLAGSMREQVCIYMCPWPRIQAALTDEDALNVSYRADRGEPRGAHKKGTSWDGRGDCIDCRQCVAACPMGIDIREGAQLECVQCALCIDACDDIMRRVDRPLGLIAYDTDANIARRAKGERPVFRLVRPRTVFYAAAILLVSSVIVYGLTIRSPIDVNLHRDRNPSFVQLSDGSVRNGYTLRLVNREGRDRTFIVRVIGPEGLEAKSVGLEVVKNTFQLEMHGAEVRSVRLYLTLPADAVSAYTEHIPITVKISSDEMTGSHLEQSIFLAGESQ